MSEQIMNLSKLCPLQWFEGCPEKENNVLYMLMEKAD